MKHVGLFAFGLTTCVLVPTALHLLEAGPKQVAKLVAPGERTITIGKAKINVTVDRAFVDAGDKIHVTLVGTAEAHQRVSLALLAFESTGSGGGRVETPPDKIGRDEVTLDIPKDGKVTRTFAFTLPGNRGLNMDGQSSFGHYTILVMPPQDADQLETLRRRASSVMNPMEDKGGQYGRWYTAFNSIERTTEKDATPDPQDKPFGTPGTIARLDINTRPFNSPISISVPETAHANDDLVVAVKVTNPSKKPVDKLTVTLAANAGYGVANEYLGIAEDKVKITDESQVVALAPRETKTITFHVKTAESGTLGLFARASCDDDECYSDPKKRALTDSALDAIDILPADKAQPVVGSK